MESSPAVSSRLIGAIFVERGLITDEQLQHALAEQKRTGQRLGEILVSHYDVPRLELASALAEQWAELERPSAGGTTTEPAAPPDTDADDLRAVSSEWTDESYERRQIGAIFLERGLVTEDQLDGALEQQQESGERLGEILVNQGVVTRVDLASALAEQWADLPKLRPPGVESEPPRTSVSPALAEDLRRSIADLTTRVDGVVDRVRAAGASTANDTELAGLRETVEELKTWAEDERTAGHDTRERLEEAVRRLESVDGVVVRLDELEQRLDRDATAAVLADTAAALRHDIDALADAVQLLGDQAGTDLAPLREEIAGLTNALSTRDEVSGRLAAELAGRLAALESRPVQLAESGADERAELRSLLEAVTTKLDENVAELHARLEAHAAEGFDADAAQADANAALAEHLDALRASVESLAGAGPDVDSLRDGLVGELQAALDARIGDLSARLDAGIGGTAELGARVESLSSTVESLQSATRALDDIRDDLTRQLESSLDGRVGELRSGLEHAAASDADLRGRLESLAASIESMTHATPAVDTVRQKLSHELRALLDERVGELNARLEAGAAGDVALGDRIAALAASVEALVGSAPSVDGIRSELATELQATFDARLGELTARLEAVSDGDDDLARQVRQLAASVESISGSGGPSVDGVRAELTQELQAGIDARIGELNERLDEGVAGDADLGERIARLAHSVAALTSTAPSVDAIREDVTRELQAGLDARIGELNERLDEGVAGDADLGERIARLAHSVAALTSTAPSVDAIREDVTRELQAGLDARIGELNERLDAGAAGDADLGERIARLAHSVAALTSTAPSVDAIREDVTRELQAGLDARIGELHDRLDAGAAGDADLGERIARLAHSVAALTSTAPSVDAIREELTGELQAGLDARIGELDARLSANAADAGQRDDKLRKRIDRLAESLAAVEGTIPNPETLRDEIAAGLHGGLEARVGELRHELQSSQAHSAQTSAAAHEALRERVESLAASLEPLSGAAERVEGLRHELAGDLHRALESRIGEVRAELEAGGAEHDARQVARAEADAALRERVDGLAAAVESVAGTTGAVESLRHELATSQANVHALHGELRSVADSVAVEAGRLIDTESRLAEGLESLVHRLDAVETRVSGVETTVDATAGLDTVARDELDRLALSLGHRLDGLEHALSTGGVEALRVSLEALEQRVGAQTGIVEEQSRVTERALRKGLAALGERIADSEAAYVEAGSALRRSVERLGWAIEDADRVIAAPPVVSPEETGHVVFAPTAEGYRLVACEGVAAGVGDVLELDQVNGPVVVARVGLSPLPFDRRPCVFVEPWRPTTAPGDD